MPRRIGSGLLLSVWLILFAVEFSEDLGLFEFDDPGLEQSLDVTLASIGDAIQLTDHPGKTVFPVFSLGMLGPCLYPSLHLQSLTQEPTFIRSSLKIFKLYQVLLI